MTNGPHTRIIVWLKYDGIQWSGMMPIVNEGLEKEMVHIAKPFEAQHIRDLFEEADLV